MAPCANHSANSITSSSVITTLAITLLIALTWWKVPHPLVGLALCLLPIAVLVVVKHLFWFVTLFVVFSFFRLHEVVPALMPFKIPLLLSLGALASLAWHSLVSRQLKVYWHPSMKWLVIFWALVAIGLAFATNRAEALSTFKGIYWKIMLMTLAIIWVINTKEQLSKICWTIVVAGSLVASVALYNSVNGIGLVEGSRVTIGRQIGSMLGDPNDLALVLLFPLAFSASFFFNKRQPRFSRLLGFTVLALLSMAIIATQSRGGLLGMVAVYAVYISQAVRSKVVLMSLGGVGLALLYLAAGISERASGGAAETGIDASSMGRLYAWEAATKMAIENPFTGVGINNFYSNYYYYSSHWDGLNHAVHSTWFGVLAETGFLGLIVFITLIVSLLQTAKRSLNCIKRSPTSSPYLESSANAVYAGLIGTIVSGTFLTQAFVWPIYILAALIICVSRIVQNDSQIENVEE